MLLLIMKDEKRSILYNQKDIHYFNSVCELKTLKKKMIVLIDELNINDDGYVEKYGFFIDELFISKDIIAVICKAENSKLKEICDFYKVNLIVA